MKLLLSSDLKSNAEDVPELLKKMHGQYKTMKDAYHTELDEIEQALREERKSLLVSGRCSR